MPEERKEKKENYRGLKILGAGVLGSSAAQAGRTGLHLATLPTDADGFTSPFQNEGFHNRFDELKRAMNVQHDVGFQEARKGTPVEPGAYVPNPGKVDNLFVRGMMDAQGVNPDAGRAMIYGQNNNTVTAHELGHARIRDFRLGRALHHARVASPLGGLAALGMGAGADPDSNASKYAPAVGALSAAPTLIDEAGATFLGDKGLRNLGADAKTLSGYRKGTAKGFGTYALAGGATVAAPWLARKIRQGFRDDQTKQASADMLSAFSTALVKLATIPLLGSAIGAMGADKDKRGQGAARGFLLGDVLGSGAGIATGITLAGLAASPKAIARTISPDEFEKTLQRYGPALVHSNANIGRIIGGVSAAESSRGKKKKASLDKEKTAALWEKLKKTAARKQEKSLEEKARLLSWGGTGVGSGILAENLMRASQGRKPHGLSFPAALGITASAIPDLILSSKRKLSREKTAATAHKDGRPSWKTELQGLGLAAGLGLGIPLASHGAWRGGQKVLNRIKVNRAARQAAEKAMRNTPPGKVPKKLTGSSEYSGSREVFGKQDILDAKSGRFSQEETPHSRSVLKTAAVKRLEGFTTRLGQALTDNVETLQGFRKHVGDTARTDANKSLKFRQMVGDVDSSSREARQHTQLPDDIMARAGRKAENKFNQTIGRGTIGVGTTGAVGIAGLGALALRKKDSQKKAGISTGIVNRLGGFIGDSVGTLGSKKLKAGLASPGGAAASAASGGVKTAGLPRAVAEGGGGHFGRLMKRKNEAGKEVAKLKATGEYFSFGRGKAIKEGLESRFKHLAAGTYVDPKTTSEAFQKNRDARLARMALAAK